MNRLGRHPRPTRLHIGTATLHQLLPGLIKAVLVLNLIDAVLTMIWVYSGLAYEANPLLRRLIEASPVTFVSGKLTLVGLGSLLLWRYRRRPLAVFTVVLAFLVYYVVLLWHIRLLGLVLHSYLWS